MNRFIFALVFCFITVQANIARSQEDTTQFNLLRKNFVKHAIFPLAISESCQSSVVSMTLSFRNAGLTTVGYSSNFPAALRKEVEKNVAIFREINWVKMFPRLKGKSSFNIVIPLVYYFDIDCEEKIPSAQFGTIVEQGLTFPGQMDIESRMTRPLVVKLSKPRP